MKVITLKIRQFVELFVDLENIKTILAGHVMIAIRIVQDVLGL